MSPKKEYLIDATGKKIHTSLIGDLKLLENETVEEIFKEVEELESYMLEQKASINAKILAYLQLSADVHDVVYDKTKNYSLTSFNRVKSVRLKTPRTIVFDSSLNDARAAIGEYQKHLDEKISESSLNEEDMIATKDAIAEAYDVLSSDTVSPSKVINLQKRKITHPSWEKAMAIIKDSQSIDLSKRYLTFSKKREKDNKQEQILLNFTSMV